MKTINVEVKFISSENGGRKTIPGINGKYYPTIRITKDGNFEYFSVCMLLDDKDNKIEFEKFFDSKIEFFCKKKDYAPLINSGLDFSITEGSRVVGIGRIIENLHSC